MSAWLIVGLGNPGPKYALNRHNIGFLTLDLLARGLGLTQVSQEHKAEVYKCKLDGHPLFMAKPMTYMNKSGDSVRSLMEYYKIELERLVVVHDDIDQSFGRLKLQRDRGHGGHNGVRHISEVMSSSDYLRIKMGVGRPNHPRFPVADYVLQNFSEQEQSELTDFLNLAGDAIEAIVSNGFSKASNEFSGRDIREEGVK